MKAVVCDQYGPPDVLELQEVPRPVPQDHQVLVKVHAVSINDWDWSILQGQPLLLRGLYGFRKPKARILGSDIAGRIEAIGGNVDQFVVGDEVYGDLCMCGFGGFAEYVCAPSDALTLKPAAMTFEQAAAIPQAAMLALQGIQAGAGLQPGQKLLINGAGGGVGTLGIQLARLHQVEVTGVDSAEKLDMMRAQGFDHVIDYRREDFTRNGNRYDLIIDAKSTRSPFAYARALNPGGVYAMVGGEIFRLLQTFILGPLISRVSNKTIRIVALQPNKDLTYINELFNAGKFVPVLDRYFELSEIATAMSLFGRAEHQGKIVLRVPHHSDNQAQPQPR